MLKSCPVNFSGSALVTTTACAALTPVDLASILKPRDLVLYDQYLFARAACLHFRLVNPSST
jgi:hypothetical protein